MKIKYWVNTLPYPSDVRAAEVLSSRSDADPTVTCNGITATLIIFEAEAYLLIENEEAFLKCYDRVHEFTDIKHAFEEWTTIVADWTRTNIRNAIRNAIHSTF